MEFDGLYVVATPIGNLSDISQRVATTLGGVTFVAAEDTRNTVKLMNHLGLRKELVSYHAHNIVEKSEYLVSRMLNGESCALVSDAGTPAISDPGEELVKLCHEKGVRVTPVPGPSAVITALSASGMATGRFTFEGFLSTAVNSRKEHLESLKDEKRTMVFYEAPHKLVKTLRDMLAAFGDREITVARELTKYYEEIKPMTLSEALAKYRASDPIGEFVLIVSGAREEEKAPDYEAAGKLYESLVAEGKSRADAVRETAKKTGLRRNDLYERFAK